MIKGTVALIGSGELSGTMVETHKALLAGLKMPGKAYFLDTPAGFQENVDLISRRAVDFFESRVGHKMDIASFKTAGKDVDSISDTLFRQLSEAGFVLIGPGSPTYAVRQLKDTPVPALLSAMVIKGGALVLASAAALTAGTHTLPVYEIYKVGHSLHWVKGLNILGNLGHDLVVIPHWNNAEGGNHDTRYCYMGEKRFRALEKELPDNALILGLDEHTACILNFAEEEAKVLGIGRVTVRQNGRERYYGRREKLSFRELFTEAKSFTSEVHKVRKISSGLDQEEPIEEKNAFWEKMHHIEANAQKALTGNDRTALTSALLEADQLIWQAQLDLENPEFISQGREIFREMIVLSGTLLEERDSDYFDRFNQLINAIVALREAYRREERWTEADQIRDLLQKTGVSLEDTPAGPRYHIIKD